LTTKPIRRKPQKAGIDGPTFFDDDPAFANPPVSPHPVQSRPYSQPTEEEGRRMVGKVKENQGKSPESEPSTPLPLDFGEIDREKILEFINGLALPSYQVRSFQMNDYLKSLFNLSNFLLTSGLDVSASEKVRDAIVERIHNYILQLKASGKYAEAKQKVLNFEMLAKVYDAFGEQIKQETYSNLFSESDVDVDRHLRIAEKQLGNEGIANAYGRKYDDPDNQILYKVDVILFASDENQMLQLHDFAKNEYHKLNDKYRQKTTRLPDSLKTRYRNIVRDSAEISNIPFNLSENINFRNDENGIEYEDHLFVDEVTGKVRIRLNSWEKKVIESEQKREDFRCWYRNPSKGSEALVLYRKEGNTFKPFYPDFLIIRKENGDDYVVDILEPHDSSRNDNVSKAQALAQYASENPCIGRAQLIRVTESARVSVIRRLDFAAHGELRDKVATILTDGDLEKLFKQYGEEELI